MMNHIQLRTKPGSWSLISLKWNRRLVLRVMVIFSAVSLFVSGVPFIDSFQSTGFLNSLPPWMQAAMIGAFAALSIWMALSKIRLFKERGAIGPATKKIIAVLFAVTLLPSFTAVRSEPGINPIAAEDNTPSNNDSTSKLIAENITLSDLTVMLEAAFGYLGRYYDSIDRETLEPQAVVARIGKDPDAILEFVRTQTMLVPYIGSLRGHQGVLADRLGNSLDRSLLLQELLRVAGHPSRLARGHLSNEMIKKLVRKNGEFPKLIDHSVDPGFDQQDILNDLGLDESSLDIYSKTGVDALDAMKAAVGRVSAQADYLYRATEKGAGAVEDTAIHEALRDHWWVQIRSGTDWLDLDPSGVVLSYAGRPSGTSYFDDKIPDTLLHTVTVRVGIAYESEGELQEEILLESVLPSRDYVGHTVRVLNLAKDFSEATTGSAKPGLATTWIPVLADGGQLHTDKTFSMDGKVRSVQELSLPSGHTDKVEGAMDLFGSLPGSNSSADSGDHNRINLRSQWIDYEIYAPGRKVETYRRMILDSGKEGSTNEEGIALALSTVTDIVIQSTDINALYLDAIGTRSLLAYKEGIVGLLRASTTEEAEKLGKSLLPTAPNAMELFVLAQLRNLQANPKSPMYLDRANILTLHTGVRKAGSDRILGFKAFDIVANGVAVYDQSATRSARIFQGVWDTRAEFELARILSVHGDGIQLPNAATLFRVTDASRWSVSTEFGRNGVFYSVVAPGGEHRWMINDNGTTLGIGPNDWGSANMETAEILLTQVPNAMILGLCIGNRRMHYGWNCFELGFSSVIGGNVVGGELIMFVAKLLTMLPETSERESNYQSQDPYSFGGPDAGVGFDGSIPDRSTPSSTPSITTSGSESGSSSSDGSSGSDECLGPCMDYLDKPPPQDPDWFTDWRGPYFNP